MLFGFCGKLPGQLLNEVDQPPSQTELQELLLTQRKRNNRSAIQTSNHATPEKPLPSIPPNITHVYTRQHKATGLQSPFSGPFFIEERLSNSTFKIRVGYNVKGDPLYEVRHLNDLKLAHPGSNTAEASRPKRGRPRLVTTPSHPETNAVDLNNNIASINFSVPPPGWSAGNSKSTTSGTNNCSLGLHQSAYPGHNR